ncbi:MAG: polyprenol monophosphomannose synthase [Actinobacteria bacterium]|nr:polyprenol monophosphomannose synthase [Actinomycetota bacterium]
MYPVIVIPTYNESENIERLIREILALDCGVSILIVDDNSPDGTGEIADRLSEELEKVHVVHRESKQGLGTAYIHGFKVALDMGADMVFEMDADFSHDPRYITQFLSAVNDHDAVIGSRYVEGGGIENWGITRELISRGGSLYARIFTGLRIKDATSGYRCYRAEVLRKIDFSRVKASGYAFQVEMAYVCTILGFDVYELPIVFTDRRVGHSKMSRNIVFEAIWIVGGLRRKYRDIRAGNKAARKKSISE